VTLLTIENGAERAELFFTDHCYGHYRSVFMLMSVYFTGNEEYGSAKSICFS